MDVIHAIQHRQSVRAFLDKPVPADIIERILEVARFAPSGANTQPWHVACLGKHTMARISKDIIALRESGVAENPDYAYYPSTWVEPYKSRRFTCGKALYGALGIDLNDKFGRQKQWFENYAFFHAPCALMFTIDAHLCKGSWLDMGMFIQNVMLAARGMGLETCPQAALAEYPDVIREHLKLPPTLHIVCGMAVGYADWDKPVNAYRTERAPVSSFLTWHE